MVTINVIDKEEKKIIISKKVRYGDEHLTLQHELEICFPSKDGYVIRTYID